jgi:hypothetical protein
MLQRSREWLVLVLIAALPFHALFVTVATKIIAGPGQSPLPILALWKEAAIVMTLLIAVLECLRKLKIENLQLKIDVLDICILVLLLWSVVQLLIFNLPFSIFHYALGFKYDFLPLVTFLLLRRAPWSPWFTQAASTALLVAGGIVAVYGILADMLPLSWFTALGYSDLHSLYVPGGPLAPFQQIESIGIRRMQSTFAGPNQLGLWLLIPFSLSAVDLIRARSFVRLFVCSLLITSIVLTFSRAAWIAAAVIVGIAAWKALPKKQLLTATCSLLTLAIVFTVAFPGVVLRATSSSGHIERPLHALKIMIDHPFGLGLGSAGPASNRFSDACVDLPAGSDASWAAAHPSLCVFVGGAQVQPVGRACSCPQLPENWYLQMGVELGVLGLVLSLMLPLLVLGKLKIENVTLKEKFSIFNFQSSIFLAFLGISIAALFLHAWEDSAVAVTVWILIATALTSPQKRSLSP